MKQLFFLVIIVVAVIGFLWWQYTGPEEPITVTNFDECVDAGNPVMESYPRQCRADDRTFVENIGNELEKTDLIRINNPRPNQLIESPLEINGEARGYWFFEADFPVKLLDGNGEEIGIAIAQTFLPWMTEDFVPFEAILEFEAPATNMGELILVKDNPSGLPEHSDQLRVPVKFSK